MFFLVTWIVAMVLLLLMTDIGRVNVVLLSLAVAAFGALVEADSWRGFDNLFVPVGIHLFLARHLETEPLALLLLTAGLHRRALRHPAARARAEAQPPCGARLHGADLRDLRGDGAAQRHPAGRPPCWRISSARRVRPCHSRYPDLDFLAAVARCRAVLAVRRRVQRTQRAQCLQPDLRRRGAGVPHARGGAPAAARRDRRRCRCAARCSPSRTGTLAATQWHGALWPWVAASFALCFGVAALLAAAARPLSRAARARRSRCRCRSRCSPPRSCCHDGLA